jgi:voltage-gated potassium channel Kch
VTLDDHIIVFGNDSNLTMFVSELRRPAVRGSAYHPLVIVSPSVPSKWDAIQGRYNDVFLLMGSLTRSAVFNRANVGNAFAVILLATSDGVTTVSLFF